MRSSVTMRGNVIYEENDIYGGKDT
jgi:hypothetical protein